MHINSLPVELFAQILNHVSSGDDMSVMLVNRTWYREYRALIGRQSQARFEEMLFSNTWDWKVRHQNIFYWRRFLANKLCSFCKTFDDKKIYVRFLNTRIALEKEMKERDGDRLEVNRLMDEFEKSSEYDGWFPDWLWKRHKNTIYRTGCKWKLEDVNTMWRECEKLIFERHFPTTKRRSHCTLLYRPSGR